MRQSLSTALIIFFGSVSGAFADSNWWVLARGTDFKTYDKCIAGDRLTPPPESYEAAKKIGWPSKLEDKGTEVDVTIDFKPTPLSLRWFRTEMACKAAAQSPDSR